MFFLDLKRADVAIRSGRLDEALRTLQTSPERGHRDAQRLIDRLATAFVDRALHHLADGRIDEARHDGQCALQLAGHKPEVTELLRRVAAAEDARRNRQQQRREVLAAAQQQVHTGAYSVGKSLLTALDTDQSAAGAAASEQLARSIEAKREIVTAAAARIQSCIDAGNYEQAVVVIATLQPDQRATAVISGLVPKVAEPLAERGLAELAAGRPDRAAIIDRLIYPVIASSATVEQLHHSLTRCFRIQDHLQSSRLSEAESELAVLNQLVGGSDWITAAKLAVSEAVTQLNSVTTGPLGLLSDVTRQSSESPAAAKNAVNPSPQRDGQPHDFEGLPARCVLTVDGMGGLLLLTKDVVRIGSSAAASSSVDVSLMTEGSGVPVIVRRDGDDYFVESAAPFFVNGEKMTRRLLASGDTIAIGSRGRLRFSKPVAASGSAVLQITGSRLPRRDIRNIVLMSDSLLFGPAGAHFRLPSADAPIVLFGNHEGFALRQLQTNGDLRAPSTALRPGNAVVMNETRFALVNC
ncbi:MAG: hypothetical protein R3C19_08260 [Planctomycetaceae bacterium]